MSENPQDQEPQKEEPQKEEPQDTESRSDGPTLIPFHTSTGEVLDLTGQDIMNLAQIGYNTLQNKDSWPSLFEWYETKDEIYQINYDNLPNLEFKKEEILKLK